MGGFINNAHITPNTTIGLKRERGMSINVIPKKVSLCWEFIIMDYNRAQDDYVLRLSFIPDENDENDDEIPGLSPIQPRGSGGREEFFEQMPTPPFMRRGQARRTEEDDEIPGFSPIQPLPSVRRGQARRALTFVSPVPNRTKLTLLNPEPVYLDDGRILVFSMGNMSIHTQLYSIPEIDKKSIVLAQSTNVPVIFIHIKMPKELWHGITIEYLLSGFHIRPDDGYLIKIRAISNPRYSWLVKRDQFAFLKRIEEGDGELRTTFPQYPELEMDTKKFLFEVYNDQKLDNSDDDNEQELKKTYNKINFEWKINVTNDPENFGDFDKIKVVLKTSKMSTIDTTDYTFYLLERE